MVTNFFSGAGIGVGADVGSATTAVGLTCTAADMVGTGVHTGVPATSPAMGAATQKANKAISEV